MINPELLTYIQKQIVAGKTKDQIKTELLQAGWNQTDVIEALLQESTKTTNISTGTPADKPQVLVEKPTSVKVLTAILFFIAIINTPSAFLGTILILILNKAISSLPGSLDFSIIQATPLIGVISIPSMVMVPCLFYAAFKVKTGSPSSWKIGFSILLLFVFVSILTGILTAKFITPMMTNYTAD
jgi:hypothetical protein